MTGYPSIDKPWLKYYKREDIAQPLPACNMYDYMRNCNKGHENEPALEFMGTVVTYGELFQSIDAAAAGFDAVGIKESDIVSFITITTPDVVYAIYGLNKLGAVCNMIDPRMPADTIASILERTASRYLIILDIFMPIIASGQLADGREIIVIPSGQPLPPEQNKMPLACKPWAEIQQYAVEGHTAPSALFVPNRPALIEYTGGTTGEPKGVVLSNENGNAAPWQFERTNTGNERGQSWLTPAAPFIAYVLLFSTHIPLSLGMVCRIVVYDPAQIAIQTIQNRYNHIAASPLMWESVMHLPEAQNHDFSHLIAPITGADYMSPKLEEELNTFFKSRGGKWGMCQGYGLTETSAGICINQGGNCTRIGSVGIPFINMTISIFDPDTEREQKYNETGEVCISGPSIMLGYFGNKTATDEMIRPHNDGLLWLHTGDLGHMDPDGFLYIDGRIKRMFVYYNGAKVFPPVIEKVITLSDSVASCVVVGMQDPEHTIGKVPAAFIIKSDTATGNNEEIIEQLKTICREHLPEYEWPVRWQFIDSFPRTPASKIDYRALEQQLI